jgi:hypothetical protein
MRQHNPGDRRRMHTPERTQITIEEVQNLLNDMAQHRCALAATAETLADWLAHSDEFAAAWTKFTANGGLTGQDFLDFVNGRLHTRPVRHRRHLRLIASTDKANPIRRRLAAKEPT